jgi:hypothetical protein
MVKLSDRTAAALKSFLPPALKNLETQRPSGRKIQLLAILAAGIAVFFGASPERWIS